MIVVFAGKSNGKTTCAVNVAAELAIRGRSVRLLNADPQGSALEAAAQRSAPAVYETVDHVDPFIHRDLPTLAAGMDDVVIDAPAGTGRPMPLEDGRIRITRSAVLAALCDDRGVVVLPVGASPYDLWAGDDLMAVIEEAWTFDGAAPGARSRAALLLNRVDRRAVSADTLRHPPIVRAARARLSNAPLPLLRTVLYDRPDYVKAPIHGLGVTEAAPKSRAAAEVRALTTELLALAGEEK